MKRLRVAVVGCGNVTEWFHVPAYRELSEQFEIVAVVDPVEPRRRAVGELAGLPEERMFGSLEEALERADIDVVDAATPPRFRPAAIELAVAAGKHVIAEKPLAPTVAEVVAMRAACERAGIVFATIHNHLHLAEIAAAVEVVESGEIGAVELVSFNRLGLVDVPGAAEFAPDWRHRPEGGGGVLMDFLHFMYIVDRLIGAPRAVSSFMVRGEHIEHTAACLVEGEAAAATVNVGWGNGENVLHVRGSKGSFTVRDGEATVVLDDGEERRFAAAERENPLTATFVPVFRDFAAAVKDGSSPEASFADGQRALETVLGAYESAFGGGGAVALPLDATSVAWNEGLAGLLAQREAGVG